MSPQNKKFNSVLATRLALLLTLSLTAGIGTALYVPQAESTPVLASAETPAASTLDDTGASDGSDQDSFWNDSGTETANSDSSGDSTPTINQGTQAPVRSRTRAS